MSAVACADAATPGGGASLRITNLSDGRQAAGQFEVRWDVSGIDGSNRVRMTARLVGEGEQGACGERLGGGGSVEFDVSGCADFAPGRAFVLRVEALDAGDTPFRRPVFEEVSLIVAGATKGTLYEPNPTANADDNASYPHAIEIRHGGDANGTILATFERQLLFSNDPGRGWLLFRSTDGGATFERIGAPIEPANHPNATVALQPCLLELATETGGFAAGTLYLAGATIDDTQFELQLFRSIDGGATFEFVSTIDLGDTKLDPRRPWEPYLLQLEDGRLVAYYSDELTPGGRQNIVAQGFERRRRDVG
ncbi:MAG: sialidase family protein [Polyangiales bacterium]